MIVINNNINESRNECKGVHCIGKTGIPVSSIFCSYTDMLQTDKLVLMISQASRFCSPPPTLLVDSQQAKVKYKCIYFSFTSAVLVTQNSLSYQVSENRIIYIQLFLISEPQ